MAEPDKKVLEKCVQENTSAFDVVSAIVQDFLVCTGSKFFESVCDLDGNRLDGMLAKAIGIDTNELKAIVNMLSEAHKTDLDEQIVKAVALNGKG